MSALKYIVFIFIFVLSALCADESKFEKSMLEVSKIAIAISKVQPNLEQGKYIEYAIGIYRASRRYNISPALLIAITHQESSFREDLPYGPSGEIGITQILKRWLKNPEFRKEFSNASEASMRKPSNSFLYAAWILNKLRQEKSSSIPYWSFYNARKFPNRIKYYQRVAKHISAIRRNLAVIEPVFEKYQQIPIKSKVNNTKLVENFTIQAGG